MGEQEASRPSIFRRTPSLRILRVDWLKAKQFDDNAEGLWRINNKLYDFVNFIERHPGGADWLELTQGTDITELFETHHISSKPEMLLRNFYVKEAKEPRNYKITFSEDGFYKTLKKKVADYCSVIQKTPMQTSNVSRVACQHFDGLLNPICVCFRKLLTACWGCRFCPQSLPPGFKASPSPFSRDSA